MSKNPYAITFGRIPNQYISRDILIDTIIETLVSDIVEEQAFKITGVRGAGKTVTLTAIERKLRENGDWIIIDLRPDSDILSDLIAGLYSAVPFLTEFVDRSLNLSAFGISAGISSKAPITSSDVALTKLLEKTKKRGKRVLIAIDEARKTQSMVNFIQEFQILIRKELPLYFIAAGLYEDIESIENSEGMTFFLRATKYEMAPLNYTKIRDDYQKTLGLDRETAEKLALMTKGYAFAYQAIGKYMWDSVSKTITDDVLAKVDEALAEKVYNKIWSELTPIDKEYIQFIAKRDSIPVADLLEITGRKHNEWSIPRKRLAQKGIIDISQRGVVSMKLPRFKEFIEAQLDI